MSHSLVLLLAVSGLLYAAGSPQANLSEPASRVVALIGTYSKGIYALRDKARLAVETESPSFLVIHPNQRFVYAANEPKNALSAFSIDASGQLKFLNSVPSRGAGPCHVALDKTRKWLFAANYDSGSVAAFPVHEDGSLGESAAFVQHSGSSVNKERQAGPHAHSVNISPDNRFLLVTDLGLDQILVYRFDAAKGTLTPNNPPFARVAAGSGPRHLAFGQDARFAYVINEMASTVTAFAYDSTRGSLREIQTLSALPKDFTGPSDGAEIAVHANGRFLYASIRGLDSIAVFTIDRPTGKLAAQAHVPTQGKTPRNFAIDPSGSLLYAANQASDNVVEFHIDQKTGGLSPAGKVFEVPKPVCVAFVTTR
jgi:6-phosphogluconolactonase